MRERSHILCFLLAMACLAFAGAGCVEPLYPDDGERRDGVRLPIQIFLPGSGYATKAAGGPVAGYPSESAVKSLQIWAFRHPYKKESEMTEEERSAFLNEGSISYLTIPQFNVTNWTDEHDVLQSVQVSMFIPSHVFRSTSNPDSLKLDFYVLGNGGSVGFESAGSRTRNELRSKVFEGNYFGTQYPDTTVPPTGLPITTFFDNRGSGFDISFLRTEPNPTEEQMEEMGRVWPTMELSRSVSRIRFLFSKASGLSNTAIDSIRLFNFDDAVDPGLIPTSSFLFPRENDTEEISLPSGVQYETAVLKNDLGGSVISRIGEMDDPTILCSNSSLMRNMSAAFFEDYVKKAANEGKVTSKIIYFRESDRPIKGIIYYGGYRNPNTGEVTPSHTAEFTMVGLGFPDRTNFYRNHSWTVYGYFLGQHMQIAVTLDDWVMPWTKEEVTIDGTASVNVDQDGKYITDAEMTPDSLKNESGYVITKKNGKPQKKWFNVLVPDDGVGVEGRVVIYAPDQGELVVRAVPVDNEEFYPRISDNTDAASWFVIEQTATTIDRSRINQVPGLIGITVKRKPGMGLPPEKKAIKLSFFVNVIENGMPRTIDANSELIDEEYHFIIDPAQP